MKMSQLKAISGKYITIGIHGEEGEQKKLVRRIPHNRPGTKFTMSNLTVSQVASYNEFGVGNTPKRSFIEGTFRKHKSEIFSKFKDLLISSPNSAFELLGIYVTNLIKEEIRKGISPGNSPNTIERKGSSTPLIDSGQLRNSITYKVHHDKS